MAEQRTYQGHVYTRNGPSDPWTLAGPSRGSIISDPYKPREEQRKDIGTQLDTERVDISKRNLERETQGQQFNQGNMTFDNTSTFRKEFNSLPEVKEYTAVMPLLMSGLQTAPNPQGDNALIYAYAKIMDPGSVVRESEGESAANTAGFFAAQAEKIKKNLGYTDARGLPAGAAEGLRAEMNRKVAQMAKTYGVERGRYQEMAKRHGFDPKDVVGESPAMPFIDQYLKLVPGARQSEQGKPSLNPNEPYSTEEDNKVADIIAAARRGGATVDDLDELHMKLRGTPLSKEDRNYLQGGGEQDLPPAKSGQPGIIQKLKTSAAESPLGTGLATYLNAGGFGVPQLMAGNDTFDAMKDENWKSALAGDVVGGMTGAMGAGGLLKAAGGALPGAAKVLTNPLAADALYGSLYGGNTSDNRALGAMGGGLFGLLGGAISNKITGGLAKKAAVNTAEAAVPSVDDLKLEAGGLYDAANASGALLDPAQTTKLAADVRTYLAKEGVISPKGSVSEVHPKVKEALRLVDEYAGNTMDPMQMQTVRKVAANAAQSSDAAEARVGKAVRDIVDSHVDPVVPVLAKARDVSSRYLQGQELEQARELAGARAGQFSGSGFENALRTEYRGLDRNIIKDQEMFNPAVVEAIMNVGRGTPASNAARAFGKLAPTGVVSGGLSAGVPFGIGTALGGPGVGAGLSALSLGTGAIGRKVATNLTDRNAQIAEILARNGGPLQLVDHGPSDIAALLAGGIGAQGPEYLPDWLKQQGQ